MLFRKNNVDFVKKKAVFGAKSSKIAHTKTALAAKGANFFWNGVLLCVAEGPIKNV